MTVLIQCAGMPGINVNSSADPTGQFLRDYRPEARKGRGEAHWTADPAAAMHFADMAAAFECWRSVPRNRPVREDGRPNRPLTAYSVTFPKLAAVT